MTLQKLLLILFICLIGTFSFGQQLSVHEIIKFWNIKGFQQTAMAEIVETDLAKHINKEAFNAKMDSLHAYLIAHDNQRIWIRTVMYEVQGNRWLKKPLRPQFAINLKRAIQLASLADDLQLVSELYTLYADNYVNADAQNRLFYILKAIEIQRHIGFDYFPHAYLRFLSISKATYRIMDYKQSIHYGLECLKLMKTPATNMHYYILALDLVGASYKRQGMADSTAFYYRQIGQVLQHYPSWDSTIHPIWSGITAGGIAQSLVLKKDYNRAYPLLLQNLKSSYLYEQWADASLAANSLAKINLINKNYDSSLLYRKKAYRWAIQGESLLDLIDAASGLSILYQMTHRFDSALHYNNLYHIYKDSLQNQTNRCQLSTLNAQIEFDNMQAYLVTARSTINNQRRLRNTIIGFVIATFFIALLYYKKYRLKQDLKLQLLERSNKMAIAEISHAKDQIAVFAKHIKEKDELIQQLQLRSIEEDSREIDNKLREYILVTDEAWLKFKAEFTRAYPHFYLRLSEVIPKMSASEERLTALVSLGLSNREIAGTLGISYESVARSKRRLNQRVIIPGGQSLENYILAAANS